MSIYTLSVLPFQSRGQSSPTDSSLTAQDVLERINGFIQVVGCADFKHPYVVGFIGGRPSDVFGDLLIRHPEDIVGIGKESQIALRIAVLPEDGIVALHVSLPTLIDPELFAGDHANQDFLSIMKDVKTDCALSIVTMFFVVHRIVVVQNSSTLDAFTASFLSRCARLKDTISNALISHAKVFWRQQEGSSYYPAKFSRGFPAILLQFPSSSQSTNSKHRQGLEARVKSLFQAFGTRGSRPSSKGVQLNPPIILHSNSRSFIHFRRPQNPCEQLVKVYESMFYEDAIPVSKPSSPGSALLEFLLEWKSDIGPAILVSHDLRRWLGALFSLKAFFQLASCMDTEGDMPSLFDQAPGNIVASLEDARWALDDLQSSFDVIPEIEKAVEKEAIQAAVHRYSNDAPALYNTKIHNARLEAAFARFRALSQSKNVKQALAEIEEQCENIWQSSKSCEAVSCTGHSCVLQFKHETFRHRVDHRSDYRVLHACNCGRTRRVREDPFTLTAANIQFFYAVGCCDEKGISMTSLPPHPNGGYSHWVLLRLGHSSLYDPSRGITRNDGFLKDTHYLLPWNLSQFRVDSRYSDVNRPRGSRGRTNSGMRRAEFAFDNTRGYMGFEYECIYGHRFFGTPKPVVKPENGEVKITANDVLASDLSLTVECPCGKNKVMAQLMRISIVIPEGIRSYMPVLDPVIKATNSTGQREVIFDMGCPQNVVIPRNSFMVLRLPYIYEHEDRVFMPTHSRKPRTVLEAQFINFQVRVQDREHESSIT